MLVIYDVFWGLQYSVVNMIGHTTSHPRGQPQEEDKRKKR